MFLNFRHLVLALLIVCTQASITLASGTAYFIDPTSGDDQHTGLSHSQAWKSISKANSFNFQEGDDVFLKCGTTSSDSNFVVDWSGTASDPVIIGSYYYDGTEKIGINSDGKPVIDGLHKYPTNELSGLIDIPKGVTYVTIQDLSIKNSYGFGVWFAYGASHGTVKRCKIQNTRKTNIKSSADYFRAEHNECSNGATERSEPTHTGGWPQGGISSSASHSTIQHNYVFDHYGEGILVGDYATVTNNIVEDTASKGIYIIGTENSEIAYNTVYGTTDKVYENPSFPGWHGSGIGVAIETGSRSHVSNVTIHHNVVINTVAGIRVYDLNNAYGMSNISIYSNTFIDNRNSVHISNKDDVVDIDTIIYTDNLSYTPHEDSYHSLVASSQLNNWRCADNYWSADDLPPKYALNNKESDVYGTSPFVRDTWRGTITSRHSFSTADLTPTEVALYSIGAVYGPGFSIDGSTSSQVPTTPTVPEAPTKLRIVETD